MSTPPETESARRDFFRRRVILAPMTVGSNLPFRRLCGELGAEMTVSEMAIAAKVAKGSRNELALLRRHPEEKCFGVQLCGSRPDVVAAAAEIAVERGADFIDLNLGCPIDLVTRRGGGSALLNRSKRVGEIVAAIRRTVDRPLSIKVRTGWSSKKPTALEVAEVAVAEGVDAVVVHGRSRQQRYRRAADWDFIGELRAALPVPVIGNGDIAGPEDLRERRALSGCESVMIARAALIKPWIFGELEQDCSRAVSSQERWSLLTRYVALAIEHFGDDDYGRERVRRFLIWHLDFLRRWVPPRDGSPRYSLQERQPAFEPVDALEDLLSRADANAFESIADRLFELEPVDAALPPIGDAMGRELSADALKRQAAGWG